MSIRIHVLAKELDMQSKDLMDFINQRQDVYGLEIKTSSNAIAPLYAEMISADVKKHLLELAKSPQAIAPSADAPAATPDNESVAPEAPLAAEPVKEAPPVPQAAAPAAPALQEAQTKRPGTPPPLPPLGKRPPLAVPPFASKPQAFQPFGTQRPAQNAPQAEAPKTPRQERQETPDVVVRENKPATLTPPIFKRPNAPQAPTFFGVARPAQNVPASVSLPPRGPASATPPQAAQAQKPAEAGDLKILQIKPPIIVRDFAKMMDVKPFRLISELMDMGIFASMNQSLEESTAQRVAERHGYTLDIKHRGEQQQQQIQAAAAKKKAAEAVEDIKNLESRPPIVCILGHVDHGKTTLLDTIRNTNVVAGEAGGITQHTAAYQVEHKGKKITFLDTPGHAAFSKMRERGANVTDIAILVVAADDGFMPQTDEALSFAQKAGVPIVVAINKMDSKGSNIDRVKQQMQKRSITPEDWGGETLCCPVSALKNTNIEQLLELVLLQAEIMELKANPKRAVEGDIIESQLEAGRGATATAIVSSGTLKAGDVLVCGENWCKVRALLDDKGVKIQKATPGTPVVIMGWSGAPEAGEKFEKTENDRAAKRITEERILERKKATSVADAPSKTASIEDLMAAIASKDLKTFKCIVKSDVSGTVEAVSACLLDIKSDKVTLEVIDQSVGLITKNDVDFAATAGAAIVAFNVKQENGVASWAKHEGVDIITHNIIYELITRVREAMKNLLDPELKENKLGQAEVRAVFSVTKGGKAAGCMVTEGLIKRDKLARVFRKDKEIARGRIGDLKRFKDDATEVRAGYECGMNVTGFSDYQPGDIVECFEILEIRPEL